MARIHHSRTLAGLFCFFLAWALPAMAQEALRLHVTDGNGDTVTLDYDQLDALPQSEFTTSTIWTDGTVQFSGVPLKALLDAVEVEGAVVEMIALNDYLVTLPYDELEEDVPLVATRMNGEYMSVRDKGPFWVVYPYDRHWRYRTETTYAQSIWQLTRLNVVD
ncbi:molybdopterin-dependent oxidoreductase [Tateyamaria omphalii]|nr:molybdopterin-dependent oxidoreductase [Tateyamaria omphalii]